MPNNPNPFESKWELSWVDAHRYSVKRIGQTLLKLKRISKQTKDILKPSVGKICFNLARIFRYNASALLISKGALHLCLASDGVKVDGEDTVVEIGGTQGMKMASIPQPQVLTSNIEWAGLDPDQKPWPQNGPAAIVLAFCWCGADNSSCS